jgi:demethylspheroidene O-methyltransferase
MVADSPQGDFTKRPKSHFWMKAKNNLFKSQKFHRIMSKVPIISRIARREGEEIFRLMAGFIATQVLYAWVQTGALEKLSSKPHTVVMLSTFWGFDLERSEILCRAGEAVGLVKKKKGAYRLTRKGAVIIGLPGVTALIEHHKILYKDLQSPVDFFKGLEETQLSKFWPYVFSAGMELRSSEVEQYSNLMSESQYMVAADTLASVKIRPVCRW